MSQSEAQSPAAPPILSSSRITKAHEIALLERFLVRNGTFGAALLVLAGALANHVRRILVPWLGQFIWWHAIENMKFATSSPHYFLEESLSFPWSEVLLWACWTWMGHFVSRSIRDWYGSEENPSSHRRGAPLKRRQVLDGNREFASGIHAGLQVVIGLTLMERHYTQTCFCAAFVLALSRVVVYGGAVGRAFLWDRVSERWLHAAFQCGLVLHWAYGCLVPAAWNVVRAAVAGKPTPAVVHGIVWGVTAYLVRYSNKYFLFLELSDMLVTLGWMTLGLVTVMLLKMDMMTGWTLAKEGQMRIQSRGAGAGAGACSKPGAAGSPTDGQGRRFPGVVGFVDVPADKP
ncbi:uncharacterized protein MAM_07876 [Metarhizium album ARSEF 1941]|uniref:Uncharacterized protein n=1 Tax=Metarhizium album (strain ARSEF 1941) TaxID=1081103 RepID=A0A0B2WMM6_METAS|nr:uncharacterized protein MAM_07876 [Metarhizium album ARSEF 1941]KHN94240.1 hypothetical protein MAM_07876 [Metarhizium album ARSEF 1941]